MVNNFTQNVEISCKTFWKNQRKSYVKICVKLLLVSFHSVKLHFPTNFSYLSHSLSRNHSTSIVQLFHPHFHTPYYYNYKLFI